MDHAILEALMADGPLHVEAIAERIDEDPIAVDQACYRLREDGRIRMVGGGQFRLADHERDHLRGSSKRNPYE